MSKPEHLQKLRDRAEEAGQFTLNDIRSHFAPKVSSERLFELSAVVHELVKDWAEEERVCALAAALMMELI
jgi:hypothetical protein